MEWTLTLPTTWSLCWRMLDLWMCRHDHLTCPWIMVVRLVSFSGKQQENDIHWKNDDNTYISKGRTFNKDITRHDLYGQRSILTLQHQATLKSTLKRLEKNANNTKLVCHLLGLMHRNHLLRYLIFNKTAYRWMIYLYKAEVSMRECCTSAGDGWLLLYCMKGVILTYRRVACFGNPWSCLFIVILVWKALGIIDGAL